MYPQTLSTNGMSGLFMLNSKSQRKKPNFDLGKGEQSFGRRDSIVCVYANGRYPAIYSLLEWHPFPAQTACNPL